MTLSLKRFITLFLCFLACFSCKRNVSTDESEVQDRYKLGSLLGLFLKSGTREVEAARPGKMALLLMEDMKGIPNTKLIAEESAEGLALAEKATGGRWSFKSAEQFKTASTELEEQGGNVLKGLIRWSKESRTKPLDDRLNVLGKMVAGTIKLWNDARLGLHKGMGDLVSLVRKRAALSSTAKTSEAVGEGVAAKTDLEFRKTAIGDEIAKDSHMKQEQERINLANAGQQVSKTQISGDCRGPLAKFTAFAGRVLGPLVGVGLVAYVSYETLIKPANTSTGSATATTATNSTSSSTGIYQGFIDEINPAIAGQAPLMVERVIGAHPGRPKNYVQGAIMAHAPVTASPVIAYFKMDVNLGDDKEKETIKDVEAVGGLNDMLSSMMESGASAADALKNAREVAENSVTEMLAFGSKSKGIGMLEYAPYSEKVKAIGVSAAFLKKLEATANGFKIGGKEIKWSNSKAGIEGFHRSLIAAYDENANSLKPEIVAKIANAG